MQSCRSSDWWGALGQGNTALMKGWWGAPIRGLGGHSLSDEGRENCCVCGGLRVGSDAVGYGELHIISWRSAQLQWLFSFVLDGARRGAAPGSMAQSNHADRVLVR